MLQFPQEEMLTLMGKQTPIDLILKKLTEYTDHNDRHLIQKFSVEYLMSLIDRSKMGEIERVYGSAAEGLNIFDFTRFFLNIIEHKEEETLYLAIAIIDLFREVIFFNNVNERVQFCHLTNYLCKGILQEGDNEYQIKARLLPNQRKLNPSGTIREVQVFAPVVYGKIGYNHIKLSKGKLRVDRTKHTGVIVDAFYSHMKRTVFCLDTLSQSIAKYDTHAQFVGKVTPTTSKIKRDAIIIAFAYGQRQQRVGALLKTYELIFWDVEDNFTIQKSFSTTKATSELQVGIRFLEYHNVWVTTDLVGGFSVWDLQNEQIKQSIRLKSKVTQLCEIRCLNLVAIAQQKLFDSRKDECESKIILYNLVKNSIVIEIGIGLHSYKHRAISTLQFSNTYQILLYGNMSKEITLLEIDPQFFDATVKGKLTGHEYVVNTFILIKKTPTVVSCDDKQKIKIWDIRSGSCVQTLDFQGKTIITKLISMIRIDKFAITGGRLHIIDIEKREEGKLEKTLTKATVLPTSVYFDPATKQILVFTKHDLRFYNLETGKVNRIFTGYTDSSQQVTYMKYLNSCRMFILGNHQGAIRMYSKLSGSVQKTLTPHSKQVSNIHYDSLNHLYISSSFDSHIVIQKERDGRGKFQMIRSIKDNFFKREINLCELSVYHNYIVIGGLQQKMIYLWDYEYCKLLGEISLRNKAEPTAFCFINGYSMLVVGDNQGNLSIIELLRPDNYTFTMQLVTVLELGDCPTHIVLDMGANKPLAKTDCRLVVAVKKGTIYQIDLSDILSGRTPQKHISTRLNYNPQRQLNQSFISEYGKKLFKTIDLHSETANSLVADQSIYQYRAHQDDITSLTMLNLKNRNFCTCSLDKRVKIWAWGGQLLCDVNVNLSLPYKWALEVNDQELVRDRIMFALKILQLIIVRNKSNITLNEWNMLKINNFFKKLLTDHKLPPKYQDDNQNGLKIFFDQFNKDDADFDRPKRFLFREVGGPRLKELEAKKRTRSIQKNLKQSAQKAEEQKLKAIEELRLRKIKQQQKQQMGQMFRQHSDGRISANSQVKELFSKLQKVMSKPQPLQQTKYNLPKSLNKKERSEIRINRHRTPKTNSRKHISFEEYYQKSFREPLFAPEQTGFPKSSQSQFRVSSGTKKFAQVLRNLNDQVRSKKLLHRCTIERGPQVVIGNDNEVPIQLQQG